MPEWTQCETELKGSYGSPSGVFPPACWLSYLAEQAVWGTAELIPQPTGSPVFIKQWAPAGSHPLLSAQLCVSTPWPWAPGQPCPSTSLLHYHSWTSFSNSHSIYKTLFLISSWRTEVTKSLRWNWRFNPAPQLSSQCWSLLQPYLVYPEL